MQISNLIWRYCDFWWVLSFSILTPWMRPQQPPLNKVPQFSKSWLHNPLIF
jgi:hypothetical protein